MFALSFLAYTIAFVNGHPNAFSWTPKDSEDDVAFRSLSYGDVPTLDDFEKLGDLNDLDVDDDDSLLEYKFMRSNKRSPSSVSNKSFKNKAGYYLIEGANHGITGTTSLSQCQMSGVFEVGKTNGIPFYKSKASGWFLAITPNGQVYMAPAENNDTRIYSVTDSTDKHVVYLYRIVATSGGIKRLYLDITPLSSRTVDVNSTSHTTQFNVRSGKKTC